MDVASCSLLCTSAGIPVPLSFWSQQALWLRGVHAWEVHRLRWSAMLPAGAGGRPPMVRVLFLAPCSRPADAGLRWSVCLSWPLAGWASALRQLQPQPCHFGYLIGDVFAGLDFVDFGWGSLSGVRAARKRRGSRHSFSSPALGASALGSCVPQGRGRVFWRLCTAVRTTCGAACGATYGWQQKYTHIYIYTHTYV